ncbi:hypothetical protein J1605_003766 [Eschrichtius robustus]|uniref:UBX domain-containing protein n=1 Tax=Eschrichtius robustus TaxID=9764 RepID=A0AB34HNG8_ESCRO|nr:hypothetical protein J1605_003766 [Eschrichtius robustus]
MTKERRPVDRDPVVCHPDLEVLLQAWPAELPDEFFEVTVDDVRRRLAQLKSERKRLEEAPLVTKAFRDAQMKEKLQRYPKVVLRVLFPDRYILQGFFRPSETVGDLRDFVRSHLGNPKLPFYLFIAPPKTILDDHTLTLFQARVRKLLAFMSLAGPRSGCRLPWRLPRGRSCAPESDSSGALGLPSCTLLQPISPHQAMIPGITASFGAYSHGSPRVQRRLLPVDLGSYVSPYGVPPTPALWAAQANLFPAALVHFGPEEPTGIYLEPTLLEHTVSPSAADVLVARSMSRAAGTPPPPPAPDPALVELEPTAEEGAVGPPEPSPGTAQPVRRGLGKVPKWLKLPGQGPSVL